LANDWGDGPLWRRWWNWGGRSPGSSSTSGSTKNWGWRGLDDVLRSAFVEKDEVVGAHGLEVPVMKEVAGDDLRSDCLR